MAATASPTATSPGTQKNANAPLLNRTFDDRLSLPLRARLPLACTIGTFSGFLLGVAKGAQDCGLRFRAENAHRLPTTHTGWFFYHKSKNYNVMLGGIFEGFKQGARFGVWCGMYFLLEEGVDRGRTAGSRVWREVFTDGEYRRYPKVPVATVGHLESLDVGRVEREEREEERQVQGHRDCWSSMFAGLVTAGAFSAWNRFPLPTATRTARMGAKAGLAFGILQDMLSLLKGRKVGYVEFIKRHMINEKDDGIREAERMAAGQTTIPTLTANVTAS